MAGGSTGPETYSAPDGRAIPMRALVARSSQPAHTRPRLRRWRPRDTGRDAPLTRARNRIRAWPCLDSTSPPDSAARAIVTMLALASLAACSGGLQESELYGAYVATYENGTQKLTLEKDGAFVQEVRLKGSDSVVVNSGTWKYNRPSNYVDLENCLGVNDGFGRIRANFATNRGGCSYPVERRFLFAGQLRLGPDESSPLWKVQ